MDWTKFSIVLALVVLLIESWYVIITKQSIYKHIIGHLSIALLILTSPLIALIISSVILIALALIVALFLLAGIIIIIIIIAIIPIVPFAIMYELRNVMLK